jgi:hypothetical protein
MQAEELENLITQLETNHPNVMISVQIQFHIRSEERERKFHIRSEEQNRRRYPLKKDMQLMRED